MVKDHLGKEYDTQADMCNAYHISPSLLINRMKRGYSLAEALTGVEFSTERMNNFHVTVQIAVTPPITDYLGQRYDTMKDMLDRYGVTKGEFKKRARLGHTLYDILTKMPYEDPEVIRKEKYRQRVQITDEHGNVYANMQEYCKATGYNYNTVSWRKKYRSDKPLSPDYTRKSLKGPDSNYYNNLKELCQANGLSYCAIYSRIHEAGYTLEEATDPNFTRKANPTIPVTDPFGNQFNSVKDMTNHYGIKYHTYTFRLRAGWTRREALGIDKRDANKYVDHLGNSYTTIREMAKHYGISGSSFTRRLKLGYSVKEALTKKSYERKKVNT